MRQDGKLHVTPDQNREYVVDLSPVSSGSWMRSRTVLKAPTGRGSVTTSAGKGFDAKVYGRAGQPCVR